MVSAFPAPEALTKAAKRNAQRSAMRAEQRAAGVSADAGAGAGAGGGVGATAAAIAALTIAPAAAPAESAAEQLEKRVRAVKKKLRACDELQEKAAGGATLTPEQQVKLASRPGLAAELEGLELEAQQQAR